MRSMAAVHREPAKQVRILMDLSTSCRWTGPPVGIVRVERALARWARQNLSGIDFVFFDPRSRCYHHLDERWLDSLLEGTAFVDSWLLPEVADRIRFIDRIPRPMQPAMRFVLRFRRQLLMTLEARRLRTTNQAVASRLDRLQRRLMSKKYAALMIKPDGARRPLLPPDLMIAGKATPRPGDIFVSVGSGWAHSNVDCIAALRRDSGTQFALLVHDLLPLTFSHHFPRHDVAAFEKYMTSALPLADRLLFGSWRTRADTLDYCREHGIPVGQTCVVPFGADVAKRDVQAGLPPPFGLQASRYVLFVSTIEPRKGHGLLLEVWRRLLAAGIPQASDFQLVFVGREGWMIGDLKVELDRIAGDSGRVQIHSSVDDETLAALYANAAFCAYPSQYEGYGLPLIEAFRHGKAVIASDRGAIPEVVGEFSPCLPADDVQAWFGILSRWMSDPSAREPYETAIRDRFRPTTWDEAGEAFFASLHEPDG